MLMYVGGVVLSVIEEFPLCGGGSTCRINEILESGRYVLTGQSTLSPYLAFISFLLLQAEVLPLPGGTGGGCSLF